MPEIKHNFTGGRMNKDLDERLVPNGEYRDAMNVQVSTSEGSDVGTVQNILGNAKITSPFYSTQGIGAKVVASVADEKNDTFYWFVYTHNIDYIFSYKRNDTEVIPVFRDVHKNVLKFDPDNIITGVNIIDDMLFWTDNQTEPKKINIPRCKNGTPPSSNSHTKLVNESQGITDIDIEEKHITVIKKTPPTPMEMQLERSRDPDLIYTGVITTGVDVGGDNYTSFTNDDIYNFSSITTKSDSNTFNIRIERAIDGSGVEDDIGNIGEDDGLTGWHDGSNFGQGAIPVGTKIVFKPFDADGTAPGLPVTSYALKGVVEDAYPNDDTKTTYQKAIRVRIVSIDGFPPIATEENNFELKYVVDLFEEEDRLFEFKFPRFSYRYKYEDGEYSPFAPFTQVAFSPGSFDYHPKKGYNLGMTNKLKGIKLRNFINESTPKDVVSVDVLFKDEPSPNVYVVDTISPDDYAPDNGQNAWNQIKNGKFYTIDKETVNSVTPSNQMLRPWDNVPRKALAQDITGNRVVYGNYIQNYDLITDSDNKKYFAEFNVTLSEFETSLRDATKSIKSLREYQLGVVFIDKYGRETPVISNPTGTKKISKNYADKNNRFEVQMLGNKFPKDLTHFKFFVKETSDQYYNMAMDRWYDAEDGNIWLAFPSSDRNKIDIDTFLILKKGTDADTLVKEAAKYKVLAIENEAPDFIKTTKTLIAKNTHDLTTATDKDIFGSTDTGIPKAGVDEFTMKYAAFDGTTGSNLTRLEGELHIEFTKANETEVSNRYKITSITNNWDETFDADGNFDDAEYNLRLEKPLGDDVNFISDDPLGNSVTKIDDGATVNIYEYKVENKPQFDGRFFVKIYKDEVFTSNITVSTIEGFSTVVSHKKIYGIKDDHHRRHTKDVDRFHIRGAELHGGGNCWDIQVGMYKATLPGIWSDSNWSVLSATELGLGYYLDDKFSSFALYFRRYKMGELRTIYTDDGNSSTTLHPLHYLEPGPSGGSSVTYDPHDSTWVEADYASVEFGNYNYNDETDWTKRHYGMTANFMFFRDHWEDGQSPYGYHLVGGWIEYPNVNPNGANFKEGSAAYTVFEPVLKAENPQDTEVWFIDRGPRIATTLNDTLHFGKKKQNSQAATGGNIVNDYSTTNAMGCGMIADGVLGNGVRSGSDPDTFNMEIGVGGLKQVTMAPSSVAKTGETLGFFNVGDWVTGPEGFNSEYEDHNGFTDNLALGSRFRWKEDPNQTVYTIETDVEGITKLRHSYKRNWTYVSSGVGHGQPASFWNHKSLVSSNGLPGEYTQSPGPGLSHVDDGTQNMFLPRTGSMAENLSFNFTKNWNLIGCKGINGENMADGTQWNPDVDGIITNGLYIAIPATDSNGSTTDFSSPACQGSGIEDNLKIWVASLSGTDEQGLSQNSKIHVGMALVEYTSGHQRPLKNHLGANSNDYLVVRHIKELSNGTYELWLGGYSQPITLGAETQMAESARMPDLGTNYIFQQVGINGYSPNSEFNINTMGNGQVGKVGSVGYTLEFLTEPSADEEFLSTNPAIFETEPKDIKDLDIYYETTGAIPMDFDTSNVQDAFPIGTYFTGALTKKVVGYRNQKLYLSNKPWKGDLNNVINPITAYRPDGLEIEITVTDIQYSNSTSQWYIEVDSFLYESKFRLPWHNCFSFGNGVESNRIRDNFNLTYIANGVKASTTLEQEYKEEHRQYGLIYSGLYNSTSGVNNLNQFVAAEKITKDINPIYGSIQKLHSRDTDLVTLCEDKCLRILANKDALYNADGNQQLVATENVLGQTVPFSGEYGISTNPESFASESYRVYFTDKIRGTVMRLSRDGLTPISDHGMKDWFKDNLRLSNKIIGSYDDKKDEYNVTLKDIDTTVSFKEDVKGWVSFKSFTPENAISMANDYYTFVDGELWKHHAEGTNRNNFYGNQYESSVTVVLNDNPSAIKEFNTLNYEGSQSKVEKFTSAELKLDFQPTTTYNDQEYYNLSNKNGWHVESITTNDEDGYIDEFLEKEGKWFNYIKKEVDLSLQRADTGDFSFQGIGFAETDYAPPDPCSFNYGFGLTAVNPQNTCVIYGGGILMAGGGDINLNLNNLVPVPPLQTAPWHFEIDLVDGTSVYVGPTQTTSSGNYQTALPTGDYIAHMVFDECPEKGNSIPFQVDCQGSAMPTWDCDGQGNCSDPGTGNGQYTSLAACQAACCIPCNGLIFGGATDGPSPATNANCDNGTIAQMQTTNDSSPWTFQIWETGIPGQHFGGTLVYEQTNIPSGTYSNTVTLPQGEYHMIRIDNTGCPVSGCIGTGNAFTVGCTY